jgi:hypothetical protein
LTANGEARKRAAAKGVEARPVAAEKTTRRTKSDMGVMRFDMIFGS